MFWTISKVNIWTISKLQHHFVKNVKPTLKVVGRDQSVSICMRKRRTRRCSWCVWPGRPVHTTPWFPSTPAQLPGSYLSPTRFQFRRVGKHLEAAPVQAGSFRAGILGVILYVVPSPNQVLRSLDRSSQVIGSCPFLPDIDLVRPGHHLASKLDVVDIEQANLTAAIVTYFRDLHDIGNHILDIQLL